MADESTDSATQEQLGIYARYINLDKKIGIFRDEKNHTGHPNTENLFTAMMEVIDNDDNDFKVHLASVMMSERRNV